MKPRVLQQWLTFWNFLYPHKVLWGQARVIFKFLVMSFTENLFFLLLLGSGRWTALGSSLPQISALIQPSLWPHGWVSSLMCMVSSDTLFRQVGHSKFIQLIPGGLKSRCRNISEMMKKKRRPSALKFKVHIRAYWCQCNTLDVPVQKWVELSRNILYYDYSWLTAGQILSFPHKCWKFSSRTNSHWN